MAKVRAKRARRFRDEMRRLREEQLVRAGSSLLLRKGCHELRVEDIAAACGVAKGTCYQHFPTRPDLISASVRRLDEALARRLLSPSPRLTEPSHPFRWALLEAVEAQILTLTQRARHAHTLFEPPDGEAWPCCLAKLPCPHGGAARSIEAIRRSMRGAALREAGHAPLYMTLLLALAPSYLCLGHRSLPNARIIRSSARRLFKQFFH